jgi:hypothetical protein
LLETGDDLFNSFRVEVEGLRTEYAQEVRKDSWSEIELNLDSLLLAWDRLDWDHLKDIGEQVGLRSISNGEPRSEPDEELFRRRADTLVDIGTRAGYETVGDIADALQRLLQERKFLESLAEASEAEGFKAYAIPPDLLIFFILVENPQLINKIPYVPQLRKALLRLSKDTRQTDSKQSS